MLKIKMFIIFLFSIILIVWFYTKTLNFRLNLYLINNNVNVGIATLKDKDLVVVNNKKYPLLSVRSKTHIIGYQDYN